MESVTLSVQDQPSECQEMVYTLQKCRVDTGCTTYTQVYEIQMIQTKDSCYQ